ncbi:carboxylesterase family protein [Conexibacter woesei]|uniref:carboxylesterase family protein n=1 Tax=Conexibacter woesei TaxID=191495 RepID=UPI0004068E8F|nr:carboxylesterase family protein [Conexibacter woesei]
MSVDVFRGLPYARAERFGVPEVVPLDAVPEPGARPFGPVAPQPARPIGAFTHGELPAMDEAACLTLNVWRPRGAAAGAGLPVLVWIHGGGFTMGWGSASLYDGARLAEAAQAVVITINYRLGSLGWLFHPELGGGNWGLRDQQAALRWVQGNVEAFGGDPARVTLAGQSAGALSAIDHLHAIGSDGLFQRLLLLSPPVFDAAHAPAMPARWAEALAERAGSFAALRHYPADQVVALHEDALADGPFAGTRGWALPTIDPATLPGPPDAAARARTDIPVLLGTTADEGAFFFRAAGRRPEPGEERLIAMVAHMPGVTDAPAVIAAYRERLGAQTDTNTLLVRIGGDHMVIRPTDAWARERLAAGGTIHRLRIDHAGDPDLGALHSIDAPLLFGTYGDGGPGTRMAGNTPRAEEVSKSFMNAAAAFVGGDAPGWDALRPDGSGALAVFGGPEGTPPQTVSAI